MVSNALQKRLKYVGILKEEYGTIILPAGQEGRELFYKLLHFPKEKTDKGMKLTTTPTSKKTLYRDTRQNTHT